MTVQEEMQALRDYLVRQSEGHASYLCGDVIIDTAIAKITYAHRDPKLMTAKELFADTAIVAKSPSNWHDWTHFAKVNLITTLLQASIPIANSNKHTQFMIESFATDIRKVRNGGPVANYKTALRLNGKIKLENRPCDVVIEMKVGY